MQCYSNNSKHETFTFRQVMPSYPMDQRIMIMVKANGSLNVVYKEEAPKVMEGFLVGVILIISAGLNISLLTSIVKLRSFKNDTGTQLMASFTLLTIFHTFINHTTSLFFLYSPNVLPSMMYFSLCQFSAAFSLFYLLQPGIYLATIAMVMSSPKLLPPFKFLLVIVPFIYSVMIPAVILLFPQITPIRHISNRNACGVVKANSVVAGVVLFLGFIIPWAIIGYIVITTHCWLSVHNEESIIPYGLFSNNKKLLPTIMLLYLVLVVPHSISVILSQFTSSHYQIYDEYRIDSPIYITYEDTILIWLRYQFDILLPAATFIIVSELLSYFNLFRLCKNINPSKKTFTNKGININDVKNSTVGETTPVLFPTQAGLILRVPSRSNNESQKHSFVFCDLVNGVHNLTYNLTRRNCHEKPSQMNHKVVRFSQSVKEIPVIVSGSWTSTEQGESLNTIELNSMVTCTKKLA